MFERVAQKGSDALPAGLWGQVGCRCTSAQLRPSGGPRSSGLAAEPGAGPAPALQQRCAPTSGSSSTAGRAAPARSWTCGAAAAPPAGAAGRRARRTRSNRTSPCAPCWQRCGAPPADIRRVGGKGRGGECHVCMCECECSAAGFQLRGPRHPSRHGFLAPGRSSHPAGPSPHRTRFLTARRHTYSAANTPHSQRSTLPRSDAASGAW